MRIILKLERDTDNSYPGEAEVSLVENGRGEFVAIKLNGPEREVWIDKNELLYALKSRETS
jgi:hypothetical protein